MQIFREFGEEKNEKELLRLEKEQQKLQQELQKTNKLQDAQRLYQSGLAQLALSQKQAKKAARNKLEEVKVVVQNLREEVQTTNAINEVLREMLHQYELSS